MSDLASVPSGVPFLAASSFRPSFVLGVGMKQPRNEQYLNVGSAPGLDVSFSLVGLSQDQVSDHGPESESIL